MNNRSGLIIGSIPGKTSYAEGTLSLFNRRLSSRQAVTTFLESCQPAWRRPPSKLVRLTDAVHTAVFAPTGIGKGVSCIVPFLLDCPESCVVMDFKEGENYRLTADARRRMGHRVARLDPFNLCGTGGDTLNPMQFIDPASELAIDACRVQAANMVIRTGRENEPFWDDSSEIWIASLMAAMVALAPPDQRNLQTVRAQLADPEKREATIKLMCDSPAWEGMLSRLGFSLKNFQNKTLDSVMTSTNLRLNWLDSIPVANNTRTSSFSPADLLKGRMTVYLILPPDKVSTLAALLRLWIGSMMNAVISGGLQEKNKVHFICDEANVLGKMDQISEVLTIGRGYGIRMQLYYQDLGQLKKCWPDGADQTLLANTSQVFFGARDKSTCDYISAMLGKATIRVASGGSSEGTSQSSSGKGEGSYSTSTNASSNWAQQGRELLRPEEVSQLSPRTAITFAPGVPPIATTLVRYYEKSFKKPKRMGFIKAAVDTACLLITIAALAAMFTAMAYPKAGEIMSKAVQEFFENVKGPDNPGKEEARTMVSGEFAAMGREAVKDVRNTLMEVFFGQGEHQAESGTPLNPTQQMVTRELDGQEYGGMER